MTDKRNDTENKTETTQQLPLDLIPFEIGSYQVAGDRGGTVKRYSKDNQRICLSHKLTDGNGSERWYDLPEIVGYEETQSQSISEPKVADTPSEHEEETAALHNKIANLKTQLKETTDSKEHLERCNSILKRRLKESEDKQSEDQATVINEASGTAFGELKAANDQITKLTARVYELENPRIPQLPLVEVKSLVREVNFKLGVHDDTELAKWMAEDYKIIPELTAMISVNDFIEMQHITFMRINQQPIQPHYPQPSDSIAEINQAFDAQADRNESIIRQTPSKTPYTDLLRQGFESEEIRQAATNKAVSKARAAGLASQASHNPPPTPSFLPEVIKQ